MNTIKELIKSENVTVATFDVFKNRVTTMYYQNQQWHVFQHGVKVFQGEKESHAVKAFLNAEDLFQLKAEELKSLRQL